MSALSVDVNRNILEEFNRNILEEFLAECTYSKISHLEEMEAFNPLNV